jgi:predicted peroxiredoxin
VHSLNLIVLTPDAERFRGALTIAVAHAALGGNAALLLQLDAVSLLAPPVGAPGDGAHRANGLPALDALIEEALTAGVVLVACQSGLALAGLSMDDLDPRITAGGPVSFLQRIDPADRLLLV